MRLRALQTIAAVSAAAILLSGCSGAPQSSGVGLPATGVFGPNHVGVARVLYIADYGSGKMDILKYNRWTSLGSITNEISGPSGV